MEVGVQQDGTECGGRNTKDVGLKAGTGSDHFPQRGGVSGQPRQRLGDVFAPLVEIVQNKVQLDQSGPQGLLVVFDEAGQLVSKTFDARDELVDGVAPAGQFRE